MDYELYTLHRQFQFFRQYLFWTVSDRPFLSRLLLYLLYQFNEHIIMHITFIIILIVSLLPLSRNETNSHFLNTLHFSKLLISSLNVIVFLSINNIFIYYKSKNTINL